MRKLTENNRRISVRHIHEVTSISSEHVDYPIIWVRERCQQDDLDIQEGNSCIV